MSQASFVVLQRDNHALTRENNALHLEMIRIQEEMEEKTRAMHLQEKELQHKIEELQFLNTQKTSQLQKKDADLSKLYAQVERLQSSKQEQNVVSSAKDSIELNKLLPPVERKVGTAPSAGAASSFIFDDGDTSSKQFDALTRANKALQDRVAALEGQVRAREAEIERLGNQLNESVSTKDYAMVKAKYDLEAGQLAQELEKEQLTRQVDLLNDQVAKYEKKLVEAAPARQRLDQVSEQLRHAEELNAKYAEQLRTVQDKLHLVEQQHLLCDSVQKELSDESDKNHGTIAQLKQQLEDNVEQIARLENALKVTHYDKVSSANSVANLEAHVKVLTTELSQLKPKHDAVVEKLADATSQAKHWSHQRATLEQELSTLQNKLSHALANHQIALNGQETLRRECSALEKVVDQRDGQIRKLQASLDTALDESQALGRRLKQVEAHQLHDSQRAVDVQSTQASLHTEERLRLRQDYDALQLRLRHVEVQKKDVEAQLTDARVQVDVWKKTADQTQEQMTDTLDEMSKLTAQLKQVKVEVVQLQQDKVKLEAQLADSRREIEKLTLLAPQEATAKMQDAKWQKRLTDVVLSKQLVETQLSAATAARASLEQRVGQMETNLRSAEASLADKGSALATLQQEVSSLQSELTSTKQSKAYFEAEYEATMRAWTNHSKDFQASQHLLTAADSTHKDQLRQIHDLQAALTASQTKCHHVENLLSQAQSSRKTLEMQWTLVQEELRHAKEHQLANESTIKRLQTEVSEASRQSVQLEKDNSQLKHLVAEMELNRDNWTLQHKQLAVEMNDLRGTNHHLQDTCEQLEATLAQHKTTIGQMQAILEASDREKDQLIHALDIKTEELSALHSQLSRVSDEQSAVRKELQACQAALRKLDAALLDKEATVASQKAQLDKADQLTATLKQDVDLLKGEHVALTQDLHHMTIENQSLAGECAQLHHELDQVSGDQRGLHQHIRQIERERDGCKIELNDLKQTYRALVVEMDAVEATRSQLSAARNELGNVNATLRQQLQEVTRDRDAAVKQASELEMEVQVNLTQIKQLTLQLQQLHDKQMSCARSQELLSGALNSQHQVASELAQDRVESAATNSSLNQRLASLQAQCVLIRSHATSASFLN
ncbi:hypothetical protein, variant [Aphanomyces invadans]|uniref:Uncharacterized protein n=1 Tax=Aphanomyces invadans TaxID=157072 RepID=A0A024TT58_9STRA|nr:hypothetical protein, variant [Aphanomyces invadans]ETV97223.1 hypothetical protein, variant [Aphanomyces invadans]|eukprot:XP_008873931.1 hypothetical protein, variant [Aphanomyces invadans]